MDGLLFVELIEQELAKRKITKQTFYKESGISSATMSQWRNRIYSPSSAAIKKIEEYFGITLSREQKNEQSTIYDGLSDIKKEFIQFADELTDEQALLALRVLKSIVGEP